MPVQCGPMRRPGAETAAASARPNLPHLWQCESGLAPRTLGRARVRIGTQPRDQGANRVNRLTLVPLEFAARTEPAFARDALEQNRALGFARASRHLDRAAGAFDSYESVDGRKFQAAPSAGPKPRAVSGKERVKGAEARRRGATTCHDGSLPSGNVRPSGAALSDKQFQAVAKALADARRMALLEAIGSEREYPCQKLCSESGITKGTVSHHVRELLRAGLIGERKAGQYVFYEVRREVLAAYTAELLRRVARTGG